MNPLKKLLGIAPQPDPNGAFTPSPVALRLATEQRTNYDHSDFPNAWKGEARKVLMICTEEPYMTMRNGRRFSTGNHPVEMLVPMLHLEKAGFGIDIYTPTGQPAKIELWAMPGKDKAVQEIYRRYQSQFEKPGSLQELVKSGLPSSSTYIAIFIPGGHGAMLGLPENEDLKQVLHWAHKRELFTLSICHGPAALLAAGLGEAEEAFLYKGYQMAAFPDSLDKLTPSFGYMPGHMPWYFGEKLKALGVEIVNKRANGACHRDRKLITGDSPQAANRFGKMAAEALLEAANS